MGARHLSRRAQYLDGVPAGISFPKFMKPREIEEVKKRCVSKDSPWYETIDDVIFESSITDPHLLELMAVVSS